VSAPPTASSEEQAVEHPAHRARSVRTNRSARTGTTAFADGDGTSADAGVWAGAFAAAPGRRPCPRPRRSARGESALNRLPLTDLASVAPLGVGGAVCAVGAPTGRPGRPFEQSRPAAGLGGASEREREDLHPSMRTCAVKPVGLAAGLRLCLESWRGSSDRGPLCVPAGASPRALRSASFASRARHDCVDKPVGFSTGSRRSLDPNRGSSDPRLRDDYSVGGDAVAPRKGSVSLLYVFVPATTLKDVPTAAGESTAVNGRGGIAQGVNVEKSVGFSTIENFNRSVAETYGLATGCGEAALPLSNRMIRKGL
jgi:hypothetical protein